MRNSNFTQTRYEIWQDGNYCAGTNRYDNAVELFEKLHFENPTKHYRIWRITTFNELVREVAFKMEETSRVSIFD